MLCASTIYMWLYEQENRSCRRNIVVYIFYRSKHTVNIGERGNFQFIIYPSLSLSLCCAVLSLVIDSRLVSVRAVADRFLLSGCSCVCKCVHKYKKERETHGENEKTQNNRTWYTKEEMKIWTKKTKKMAFPYSKDRYLNRSKQSGRAQITPSIIYRSFSPFFFK